MRHVEGAVHDDIGDGIEAARRKLFTARDEIAGGVVDEVGEGTAGPYLLDHFVDGLRVADVDAVAHHASAILVHQFRRGLVAHDLAPSADMDLGAELEKTRRHGFAEPGAASGYEDAASGEKLVLEHRCHPRNAVNWSID